jgi:hypothetical protein
MLSDASTFHIEEYKSLRKEIEWVLKEYHALERNIAVLCGGVMVWLFGHTRGEQWTPQDLGFFVPFLFALLGSVRAIGIFRGFDIYHEYLMRVEDAFSEKDGLEGWEHYLSGNKVNGQDKAQREKGKQEKRKNLGSSKFAFYFWLILDVVTFAIAIVFGLHHVK